MRPDSDREMFDYIRSTNLEDGSAPQPSGSFTPTVTRLPPVSRSSRALTIQVGSGGANRGYPCRQEYDEGIRSFPHHPLGVSCLFPLQNGLIPTVTGTTTQPRHATTQMAGCIGPADVRSLLRGFLRISLGIKIQISGLSTGFSFGVGISGSQERPRCLVLDTPTVLSSNPYEWQFLPSIKNVDVAIGGMTDFRRSLVSFHLFYTHTSLIIQALQGRECLHFQYNEVLGSASSLNGVSLFGSSSAYPASPASDAQTVTSTPPFPGRRLPR